MNGASSSVYDGRKRLVLYLAAASVAAFELTVLYLSSRPNVSAAYRSYYITHGDKCYVPGAKPEIKIGEPIRITAGNFTETCPFIGEGWSIPEDWGTWTDDSVARLSLPLPKTVQGPFRLTLDVGAISRTNHQTVTISAAGRQIDSIDVATGGDREYSATIPAAAVGQGELALEFEIEDPVSPEDLGELTDPRRLGLSLHWLRLDLIEDTLSK